MRENFQTRRLVAGVAGLAVAVTGLGATIPSASANTAGTDLVISEVYGAGGNSGSIYNADYVELYNPSSSTISLEGLSIGYRSIAGTVAVTGTALSGQVPAATSYLIKMSGTGAGGAALPTPDLNLSSTAMAAGGGQAFLLRGTSFSGTGNLAGNAGLVDFVSAGGSTSFETAATTLVGSAGQSLNRTNAADTDHTLNDISVATPSPVACGEPCKPATPPEPVDETLTIAQIQGTTDVSPKVGVNATTTGVVTAKYPTGGLNGFFIQTGGPDTTPDASDGIFVYMGTNSQDGYAIGDTVTVTGVVAEYFNSTQLTPANAAAVVQATTAQPAVVAKTSIPGTDCALPGDSCLDAAALATAREKQESELVNPSGEYTVTDAYDGSSYTGGSASSANFGDLGLAANSETPLYNVSEVVDPNDSAAVAARVKYNNAHRIILDDGSSLNFVTAANTGTPVPWSDATHHPRVGAKVTFPGGAILDYRNSLFRLQPTSHVSGAPGATQPQVSETRAATPAVIPGDLKLATFNVLNYFTTLGVDVAGCTSYKDRDGVPNGTNSCPGSGPRGAWDQVGFGRQQTKIVKAINALGADVVSLEELENSVKVDGGDRDEAIGALVTALNADAGSTRWAFVPSPSAANLPDLAEQDVIRTGFIYNPATIATVGASQVLVGSAPFSNAREPLAQAFKPKGGGSNQVFAVIVNHFKSKGASGASGDNLDTGQGGYNGDRTRQAGALATFASDFGTARNTSKIFLTGDFNAYSKEDPVKALETAGFANLESTDNPGERSYSFDGGIGSLDHVFASAQAEAWIKGVDIWEINANESVYRQYSRYNANVTDLYEANLFAASDHNPEIVGFTPEPANPSVKVQILGTNDFHGRLLANGDEAGAAQFAGAAQQLRADNPNTVFAAGGDLIGASTFESFIQQDKPTLDALNAAGLDVSAAGNHEFDAGYNDLVNRVMKPFDATTNKYGGADWQYLAANVRKKSDDSYALPDVAASPGDSDGGTWMKTVGGVKVGFIGTVTEDLPTLVAPGGITDIKVTSIIDEANAAAADLKADGAEIIVLLTHEGAENTSLASATDTTKAFGKIVAGVDADVDAIISGHTHLAYNHTIAGRPVVSAGQYGTNLNKIVFSVDQVTGEVSLDSQAIVKANTVAINAPAAVQVKNDVTAVVSAAAAEADVLGAAELGTLGHGFNRAKLAAGTENRGGESTLGNLVAEAQRWAAGTDIGFMNPGGLRADMLGNPGNYPATLTYKQAAAVQPFANTLVKMDYTGAQLKTILEQQWQRDAAGNVPSRPFLRLGASKGFSYTYDPTRDEGDRITGMWLNGTRIVPTTSYSVTVNSFLATGGDNFRAFTNGTDKADTGQSDLNAMVAFMADQHGTPVISTFAQQAVGLTTPAGEPAEYAAGATGKIDLSSLAFTGAGDQQDTTVSAIAGNGDTIGTATVDNTPGTAVNDEYGKATLQFVIPAGTPAGPFTFTVKGNQTATTIPVTVTVAEPVDLPVDVQILGTNDFHGRLLANGDEAGAAQFAGAVSQLRSENPNTIFAAGGDLIGASTFESFIQKDKPTLDALNAAGLDVSAAGNHEFDAGYADLTNRVMAPYDAVTNPEGGATWQYLAANVRKKSDDSYALPDVAASPGDSDGATWMKEVDGVKVGFIGTVTEDLPALVTPGGIADIKVTSIVTEANAAAARLKADGAEIIVLLTHEGASSTDLAAATDTTSAFGKIVAGVDADVDAIISGHTHLAYNHTIAGRPVVSAGQYGTNLNKIVFTVTPEGDVSVKSQEIVKANTVTVTDPTAVAVKDGVTSVVNDAKAEADVLGAAELGKLGHAFNRATLANGSENRGGESTLGNLVAEAQRWAAGSDIAFMNPGGLRADMLGNPGSYPAILTYKQAALVQPFANTLVNQRYTGAQLKKVLEQQWQRDASGNVPSRPFLRLGASKGFSYTYDPTRVEGDRITGMWLNGTEIEAAATFTVTVNSFLSTGGDNFREFANGTDKADTGQSDLNAMVNYMADQQGAPVVSNWAQQAVGLSVPAGEPASYRAGETGHVKLSSLAFTGAGDVQDTKVIAQVGTNTTIGQADVDNTRSTVLSDEPGTATLPFTIPAGTPAGEFTFTVVGNNSGTSVGVTVLVQATPVADSTLTATVDPASIPAQVGTSTVTVTVASTGVTPTGLVTAQVGDKLVGGGQLVDGKVSFEVGPFPAAGTQSIVVTYLGDGATKPSQGSVEVSVTAAPPVQKETPSITASLAPASVVVTTGRSTATVRVTRPGGAVSGTVLATVGGTVVGVGDVVNGTATFRLTSFDRVRTATVRFAYLGDDHTLAGSAQASLMVVKATSKVRIKAPKKITVGKQASITVTVVAPGQRVTGKVSVKVGGKSFSGKVVSGKAVVKIKVRKVGKVQITANYAGNRKIQSGKATPVTVKVVKR